MTFIIYTAFPQFKISPNSRISFRQHIIEKIAKVTKNILFTTLLAAHNVEQPLDWAAWNRKDKNSAWSRLVILEQL